MFTVTLFIFIYFAVFVKPFDYDTNVEKTGWTPISREEVLRRIRNGGFERISTVTDSVQNMHVLRDNAIRVVTSDEVTKSSNNVPEITEFNKSLIETKKCATETCIPFTFKRNDKDINSQENEDKMKSISNKNIRRPKAIMDDTVKIKNNDEQVRENDIIEYAKRKLDTLASKSNLENKQEFEKTYEVIENTDHDTDDTQETKNIKNIIGYSYTKPKTYNDNVLNNNFTTSFLEILHRYNIKPEDRLTNYIQSRNKQLYDQKHYKFLPIPTKIPRYNNLNHLPVDPLIAVFLSNYGYYLPNYFGQHNNYRNLYGYLASNNNHNNQPFGLYKIFSDTDSSN